MFVAIIKCSFIIGWKSKDSVPKLVDEYLDNSLALDEFITHTMDLADVNTAFDLMLSGERYNYNIMGFSFQHEVVILALILFFSIRSVVKVAA